MCLKYFMKIFILRNYSLFTWNSNLTRYRAFIWHSYFEPLAKVAPGLIQLSKSIMPAFGHRLPMSDVSLRYIIVAEVTPHLVLSTVPVTWRAEHRRCPGLLVRGHIPRERLVSQHQRHNGDVWLAPEEKVQLVPGQPDLTFWIPLGGVWVEIFRHGLVFRGLWL